MQQAYELEQRFRLALAEHERVKSRAWRAIHRRLKSQDELSVYCDCSVMNGDFCLGVCMAVRNTFRLLTSKVHASHAEYTVLGEMHALYFAVSCAIDYLRITSDLTAVKHVSIFSDVDHLELLLERRTRRISRELAGVLDALDRLKQEFTAEHPDCSLTIHYIGGRSQRFNALYRAAHRSARWIAKN